MKQFYDWLIEKLKVIPDDLLSWKTQMLIGYMIEFLHEKFNCKEIDIHAEEGKSMKLHMNFLKKK